LRFFGRQTIVSLVVLVVLIAGCAPAAPSPTAAPAKPAAPAPAPAASPAAAAKPAEAAKPAASPVAAAPASSPVAAPAAKPAASPAAAPAAKPAASPAAASSAGPFMSEDSAEWKAILDAARREGQVVGYGSDSLAPMLDKYKDEFAAKYGIQISWVSGSGGETTERLTAEKDANRRVASMFSSGDTSGYAVYKAELLQELRGLPNGARIHPVEQSVLEMSKNQYWPLYNIVRGLVINTQLIPPAEELKNWRDLLDPKWKGKIALNDPSRSGGGHTFFEIMLKTPGYGEEFLRALAQQDLLLMRSQGEAESAVARGERAIGIPGNVNAPTEYVGAPMKWLPMAEGYMRTSIVMGIVKEARHPNAAKVFMNWLLSPEMQQRIADEIHEAPSTVGIRHPLGLNIENLKLLGPGITNPADQNQSLAKAREIFGR
jgi:iron(III) transport system substrate-binding protein